MPTWFRPRPVSHRARCRYSARSRASTVTLATAGVFGIAPAARPPKFLAKARRSRTALGLALGALGGSPPMAEHASSRIRLVIVIEIMLCLLPATVLYAISPVLRLTAFA